MVLPLGGPRVVGVEDRLVPRALNNRPEVVLVVGERVVFDGRVASVCCVEVRVVLAVCGCGPVCGSFPALGNVFGAFRCSRP